jgi:hypothetical protein
MVNKALRFNDHFNSGPGWLNELGSCVHLTTHTSLSTIRRGFAPGVVNYQKWCTRLAVACDKVYQLLAHGRWFSPGTPASSTTKTGRHDITEILLKVVLNTNKVKSIILIHYQIMINLYFHLIMKIVLL